MYSRRLIPFVVLSVAILTVASVAWAAPPELGAQAASGGAGAPTISFISNGIRITGITPGGTVLIYAVAMVRVDFNDHLERYQRTLQDDDHDGIVIYDHGKAIPPDGVWIAVDITNGQFAVASPLTGLKTAVAPAKPLHRNAGNHVDTFSFAYPGAEMIYIHPGHGAWAVHGYDGGASDHDTRKGVMGLSVSDAQPILQSGETKATEFVPGGILIVFDLPFFRVTTMRLTGSDIGGAQ
jgi:hypothetical protein